MQHDYIAESARDDRLDRAAIAAYHAAQSERRASFRCSPGSILAEHDAEVLDIYKAAGASF